MLAPHSRGLVWPSSSRSALLHQAPAAAVAAVARRPASRPQLVARAASPSSQPTPPPADTPPAAADPQMDEVVAEAAARAGWDPQGLLPPMEGPRVDHFARRARLKQQGQQQPDQQPPEQPADAPSNSSAYTTAVQQQPQAPAAEQPPPPQQQQQQQQQSALPQQQQVDAAAAAAAAATSAGGPVRVSPPATAVFALSDPVQRIPAHWLKQGGIPAADAAAYDRPAFLEKLATKFIPIDLDFPGLRIVNFDPAIFTLEGFMTAEECQQWQQAAVDSGCLQQSKIGAGNAAAAAGAGAGASANVYGARRTSSSLLLDAATQAKAPPLSAIMSVMHARASKLLAHLDGARSWGAPGRMPAGGQYCFENPQVARYTTGQHFLAHEDGFPPLLATANGFQRHATLLLYLNDVQQGGATHFDHLGVSIQPQQGMALLFFPAYANGTPDARTLHTAQDAADTKWVMQQWVARGYPTPKAVLKAVKVAALAGPEADVAAAAAAAGAASGAAAGALGDQQQPVLQREVFKVVASSSGGSAGDGYGGGSQAGKAKAKRANKKGGGGNKKGFSRR